MIDPEAARLLRRLERHWRPEIEARELYQRLRRLLLAIKRELARDDADARLIARAARDYLERNANQAELRAADQALKHLLGELGLAVASIMPLAFITVPGLLALARHFDIDLLAD